MKDDISQEAKEALANLSKRKARDRLVRDGAGSRDAIQRRVLAFAKERKLPPAEYAKLMHKRILTGNLIPFCQKHGVSAEWLLCGDLKALQKMTRERKEETKSAASTDEHCKLLLETWGKLNRELRTAMVLYLNTQC